MAVNNLRVVIFSHDDLRTIHHRDVRPETITRYSRVLACLVCFILRCEEGWDSEYSMKLTLDQSNASKRLLTALQGDHQTYRGSALQADYERDFFDHQLNCRDYLDTNTFDDDDVSDDEFDRHHNDEAEHATNSVDTQQFTDITQNQVQACLLDLLASLFTHLPQGRDDKFWSPVIRFAILYSLKNSGEWLTARQITQIFSALLFSGRLLMMCLMYRVVVKNPALRYSEYVLFLFCTYICSLLRA